MSAILDTILSSLFLITSLLIVALFTFVALANARFFKIRLLNILFSGSMLLLLAFLFLFIGYLNPLYFGFGLASQFSNISTNEKYICLMDQLVHGASDGSNETEIQRLHTLNAQTGARISRKVLGSNIFIFELERNVLMYGNDSALYFLDIENNTTLKTLDKNTLPDLYPELRAGIDEIRYNPAEHLIQVNVKNGKACFITPFDFKLFETKPPAPLTGEWESKRRTRIAPTDSSAFTLGPKDAYGKTMILKDHQGKILSADWEFIEGSLLAILEESKRFVVLHYTDTTKKEFILSCISFDLKKIWEIRQSDIKASEGFAASPGLQAYALQNQNLIFTVGGFVFAVQIADGKMAWTNRL